jgi:DNA invertase Pin-like site-specific DNA recombinase
MERPALQRLLADIQAGKVDCYVGGAIDNEGGALTVSDCTLKSTGLVRQYSHVHGCIPCLACQGKGRINHLRPIQEIADLLRPPASRRARQEEARRAARGLSQAQRTFLKTAQQAHADRGQGASLKELRGPLPKSAVVNAALSRMLERLEKRRLIVRSNWRTGIPDPHIIRLHQSRVRRTSHVLLTPLGKAVAEAC